MGRCVTWVHTFPVMSALSMSLQSSLYLLYLQMGRCVTWVRTFPVMQVPPAYLIPSCVMDSLIAVMDQMKNQKSVAVGVVEIYTGK